MVSYRRVVELGLESLCALTCKAREELFQMSSSLHFKVGSFKRKQGKLSGLSSLVTKQQPCFL